MVVTKQKYGVRSSLLGGHRQSLPALRQTLAGFLNRLVQGRPKVASANREIEEKIAQLRAEAQLMQRHNWL